MLKQIVDNRVKTGIEEEDGLQVLLKARDDLEAMTSVCLGAILAGLINTGINIGCTRFEFRWLMRCTY